MSASGKEVEITLTMDEAAAVVAVLGKCSRYGFGGANHNVYVALKGVLKGRAIPEVGSSSMLHISEETPK
jgi:hypothetical protein